MKSYLTVEGHEGNLIHCEVENIPIDQRPNTPYVSNCFFDDVNYDLFGGVFPVQGDIYSCEHDGKKVIKIYGVEYLEKARRINMLLNWM